MKCESHSVVSTSLGPHGLYVLWNSPGQNTTVGSLSLLQGIFPTQGSNPGLPHRRQIVCRLSHQPPGKGSSSTRPLTPGTGHRAQAWWPPVPSQRALSPSFKLMGFAYLFLAVLDLCCFSRAFSSCDQQGILCCSSQASRSGGFSCGGAQALGTQVQWLWPLGLAALRRVKSSQIRVESMSSALAGRFLPTAPPGKS